jgi:hypothetical protein
MSSGQNIALLVAVPIWVLLNTGKNERKQAELPVPGVQVRWPVRHLDSDLANQTDTKKIKDSGVLLNASRAGINQGWAEQ